jgi:hypothetical protein
MPKQASVRSIIVCEAPTSACRMAREASERRGNQDESRRP